MYEISKKFRFEASHSLILVEENHPCHSMHGHSYIAEFTFRSPILNNKDFLIDFRELDDIKHFNLTRLFSYMYKGHYFNFKKNERSIIR